MAETLPDVERQPDAMEKIAVEGGEVMTYSFGEGDEVHREWGGPQGALVYFSLYAADGLLADQLDSKGNIIRTTSLSDVKRHYDKNTVTL